MKFEIFGVLELLVSLVSCIQMISALTSFTNSSNSFILLLSPLILIWIILRLDVFASFWFFLVLFL